MDIHINDFISSHYKETIEYLIKGDEYRRIEKEFNQFNKMLESQEKTSSLKLSQESKRIRHIHDSKIQETKNLIEEFNTLADFYDKLKNNRLKDRTSDALNLLAKKISDERDRILTDTEKKIHQKSKESINQKKELFDKVLIKK